MKATDNAPKPEAAYFNGIRTMTIEQMIELAKEK